MIYNLISVGIFQHFQDMDRRKTGRMSKWQFGALLRLWVIWITILLIITTIFCQSVNVQKTLHFYMHLDLLQIHQFSQFVCKSTSSLIDKIVMLRWIFFVSHELCMTKWNNHNASNLP